MLPISEADPEIKRAVADVLGLCRCGADYKKRWTGRATDEIDPGCAYHAFGEAVAELMRDNRRLRRALARIQLHNHSKRKVPVP